MGAGKRGEPPFEAGDQLLPRHVAAQGIARDRLDHREDVADAVRQLPHQEALLLLDLVAVGNIHEGQHDAVDLVVDLAIGPHAHVVPAAVPATDLAPARREIGDARQPRRPRRCRAAER